MTKRDLKPDNAPVSHARQRHGSVPRRSPALRVFDDLALPEAWEVLPGVPHTRADCPTTRPCPFVKCRYHLWLVEAESMPGRRRERTAPASDFHPWSNTTCALDVAENQNSVEVVAKALGMSDRQVRRIKEQAIEKLRMNPDAEVVLRRMVER